jgi:hypothetical protein
MYVLDEKENYDIIANNLDKTKKYIKDKLKWNWKKTILL